MTRVPIPLVVDADCYCAGFVESAVSMQVGSSTWFRWLEDEQNSSFAFRTQQLVFTARRERQRHGQYWYAYRKLHGKTCKTYLGKSEELTLERLQRAAFALASKLPAPTALPALSMPSVQIGVPLPALPAVHIARPHLLARLEVARKGRLTMLAAPAGWGKTTLLVEWGRSLQRQGLSVLWLPMDADLEAFWSRLSQVLRSLSPGRNAVVLVDACHALPLAHQQRLNQLLNTLPSGVHLVLAGRDEPHSESYSLIIRATDLAFSEQEAWTLLHDQLHLPITRSTCARLVACTDGWAAGLHLAALAAQSAPEAEVEEVIARLFFGRERAQPRQEVAAPLDPVTERERDVLELLMEGASNREIAERLIISEGTVKKHVSNICSKLGVQRRSQVIHRALALR